MDDATSRARECIKIALWNLNYQDEILRHDEWLVAEKKCRTDASDIVGDLEGDGFQIIDTRTHVAIAREPSDEVVELVARALYADEWKRTSNPPAFESEGKDVREYWWEQARAAIAALVDGQTQGGEDGDV